MTTEQAVHVPHQESSLAFPGEAPEGKKIAFSWSGEWVFRVRPWAECKLHAFCHPQHLCLLNGLRWQVLRLVFIGFDVGQTCV